MEEGKCKSVNLVPLLANSPYSPYSIRRFAMEGVSKSLTALVSLSAAVPDSSYPITRPWKKVSKSIFAQWTAVALMGCLLEKVS